MRVKGRLTTNRKCGPCTFCCTWLSVPELDKRAGEECPHLTRSGCSIYAGRPQSCRDFECTWLQGEGDRSVRPDNLNACTVTHEKGLVVHGPDPKRYEKSRALGKRVEETLDAGLSVHIVSGRDRQWILTPKGSELDQKLAAARKGVAS